MFTPSPMTGMMSPSPSGGRMVSSSPVGSAGTSAFYAGRAGSPPPALAVRPSTSPNLTSPGTAMNLTTPLVSAHPSPYRTSPSFRGGGQSHSAPQSPITRRNMTPTISPPPGSQLSTSLSALQSPNGLSWQGSHSNQNRHMSSSINTASAGLLGTARGISPQPTTSFSASHIQPKVQRSLSDPNQLTPSLSMSSLPTVSPGSSQNLTPSLQPCLSRASSGSLDLSCPMTINLELPSHAAVKARRIYDMIDLSGHGSISKLDFLQAMQKNKEVSTFVLPELDSSNVMIDDRSFDAANATFQSISRGKRRIEKRDFVAYFHHRSEKLPDSEQLDRLQMAFKLIDSDGDKSISRLELMNAVQHDPTVAEMMRPHLGNASSMGESRVFDAIDAIFDKATHGKDRLYYDDFIAYFRALGASMKPVSLLQHHVNRSQKRVLIIARGFSCQLTRFDILVERAGFQVHFVNLPDPEAPCFPMMQYLCELSAEINLFVPDLLVCASTGGHYTVALWQMNCWRGPTLMINCQPGLKELPKNTPIVIAHGSNDQVYACARHQLEHLLSTGTRNMCCLFYSGSGGTVGGLSVRPGDGHEMESLLSYKGLSRLMDAAMSPNPEVHMMWSWRGMLAERRLAGEEALGYSPEQLQRFWVSTDQQGMDGCQVSEVPRSSEEFKHVATIFKAAPREESFYHQAPISFWENTCVVRVERVENVGQLEGSAKPYYESLQRSVEAQSVEFEPGVHTCWAFHGTEAIESIINDPMCGFQPLTSGARVGAVWGPGTYFARDSKYVLDTGLCSRSADGSHKILLCLLMTGMPCVGDPDHKGVLPFRERPYRYNCSVDSFSNPEIFILQHPSAAYPAYVVTFV